MAPLLEFMCFQYCFLHPVGFALSADWWDSAEANTQ